MSLKLSELRKSVGSLKLSKRPNDLTIDLYFLTSGLKPSILWDYGSTEPEKLSSLGALLGGDLIILVLGCDYLISYKTRLETLLDNYHTQPPPPTLGELLYVLQMSSIVHNNNKK